MSNALVLLLAAITAAFTIVIRIPIPGTGGYLNIGDMAVVFCGLFLGGKRGAIAGGLGSAMADLVGGFFIFAPITFIAKGFEAYIAGTLGKKKIYWVGPAAFVMVIVYFISEIFLPGMGFTAALSELPFNGIQAAVGAVGGIAVYKGVSLAFPTKE